MHLIKIEKNKSGAHSNKQTNATVNIPDGWAVIPDDMVIPETYPFVDIEVEEVRHEAEIDTQYVPDENGEMIEETVVMQPEYTYMKVVSMTAGVVPEPEPEPDSELRTTRLDIIEAQITYTAMMTDTLLEVSFMKEKIIKWYKPGLWTLAMVKNAVVKGVITAEEYQEITGEV